MDLEFNGKKIGIYIPLGYPDPESFYEVIDKVVKYVDIIELGVPSRYPIYDGPYIKRIHKALTSRGVDISAIVKDIYSLSSSVDIVVLGYFRDLLNDNFRTAKAIISDLEIKCLLIPDLLIEYIDKLREYIEFSRINDLDACFFISSKFPYRIVSALPSYRPYFIYLGLQASTGSDLPIHLIRNIMIARKLIGENTDLAIGFGIDSPEKLHKLLSSGADIAFIGTEFLKRLSRNIDYAVEFIKDLYSSMR